MAPATTSAGARRPASGSARPRHDTPPASRGPIALGPEPRQAASLAPAARGAPGASSGGGGGEWPGGEPVLASGGRSAGGPGRAETLAPGAAPPEAPAAPAAEAPAAEAPAAEAPEPPVDEAARARERHLLERARGGDRAAFEALVTEAFDGLVGFAASLAGPDGALDLAQEAVLKALRAIGGFRGEARFRSWLFRIARNTFLNERARLRVKRERGDDDALASQPAKADPPERRLELAEAGERLEAAIAALPEAQRTALLLCDRDGLAYKEIAQVMGTPIGTVMSRIYYARTKLRERLGDLGAL